MKKLLMAVAAFGMLLTSCAKDDTAHVDSVVTFTVNTPDVATRAYGEGKEATTLYWAVYDQNGIVEQLTGSKAINLTTTVDLKLIQGRTYDVLFWAANASMENVYKVDFTAKSMEIDYDALEANQESYDAFFKYEQLGRVSGAMSRTVELRRPFAQLNIGTADTEDAKKAEFEIQQTAVTVKQVFTKLDLATGTATDEQDVTFKLANKAEGTIAANGNSYDHIAMNYLLVNGKKLINVDLTINNGTSSLTRSYTSVPVERNYRTNIVGNIITAPAEFNVVILPGFTDDNYEEWDGTTLDEPTLVDGVYQISHAAEFAWVLANKKGAKLNLEADINFGGYQIPEWDKTTTAQGSGHKIEIEGNGNTIYNFKNIAPAARSASDQIVALFDIVEHATISNLTIEGATVDAGSGANAFAGILFGRSTGTVKLTNVTIKNCNLKGTNKVGPFIGFAADNTNLIVENCHAVNNTIETYDLAKESGLAGGFIGYINEGKATINNSTVEGGTMKFINSEQAAKRANSKFIGGVNYGTINLNNCSTDVDNYTDDCGSYVSPYGDLVGGNRSTAKVVINGAQVVTGNLASALKNAAPGSTLRLAQGADYEAIIVDELKDVTIEGAEGASIRFVTKAASKIENVTVKGVDFEFATGAGQIGAFVVIDKDAEIENLVIEGCTIVGDGKKNSYGIYGQNPNATIVVKNCNFSNVGYAIQATAGGGYKSLSVEGCTFENIISWAIMPQYGSYAGDLTITGCTFNNSKGGLVKSGALTAGHTFTFTNNTITNCTGHDGKDTKWFEFNVSAGTAVITGNKKDGADWTPGTAEGLK